MHSWSRLLLGCFVCLVVVTLQPLRAGPIDAGFASFLQSLWPRAQDLGISRDLFERSVSGLTPDPALLSDRHPQAEFERTIKAYVDDAVTAGRVSRGREMAARWHVELAAIERRFGVPAPIVLAIWGIESDFGRSVGKQDILRSLATLAFARPDDGFPEEFLAAMEMLSNGSVKRSELKGSWAGAMGNPQFMPTAYLTQAVSFSGQGAPDIWNSVPDSLASMANFMRQKGWKPGLSWGTEVAIPTGFNWGFLKGSSADFGRTGMRPVSGSRNLPASDDLTLFLPAGAAGPALLLTENYWVIKQYNNSDSYAVAVAMLAERIAGRPGLIGHWPAVFELLSRTDRVRLQTGLREKGFYDDKIDGRFGPASRDAIHRFQQSIGMSPADGFPSRAVLDRLVR